MANDAASQQHIAELEKTIETLQTELTEQQSRYQELFETSKDGIAHTDIKGNFLACNRAFLDLLGYESVEELCAKKSQELTPPEYRDKETEFLKEQLLAQGHMEEYEKEYFHKSGERVPVSLRVRLQRDENGEPSGLWGIVRDNSEQKQTEARIRASQQLLQTFLDNFPAIVFAKDSDGRVILANKVLYETYGMTREEMLGKTIYDLMPGAEELADEVWAGEKRVLETREPVEAEQIVVQDDSEHIKFSTIFPLINEQGEAYAVGSIALDITERRQAEVEREHLQQGIIEAQQQALLELSSPIIPVIDGIIIMPLIGNIDTSRARDITRSLLNGITTYRAKAVIIDITGVPVVDSGVANHLNKTIQAARLKGANTILTGMSDAVAETIVDLGIDWSALETLRDLQTGLAVAIKRLKASSNGKKSGNGDGKSDK